MSQQPWIEKRAGDILRSEDWNKLQQLIMAELDQARQTIATLQQQVTVQQDLIGQLRQDVELLAAQDRVDPGSNPAAPDTEIITKLTAQLPPGRHWFVNQNSGEIHHHSCPAGKRVAAKNRFPQEGYLDAKEVTKLILEQGLDGCRICMSELHWN